MKKTKAVRRKTTRYYSFPLFRMFFRSQFSLSSLLIPLCWSWRLACVILSLAYSRAVINQKLNTSIESTKIKLMKLEKARRKKERNHHGTKKAMKEKKGEKARMVKERRRRNAEVNTFVPKKKRRIRKALRMKCSDKKLRELSAYITRPYSWYTAARSRDIKNWKIFLVNNSCCIWVLDVFLSERGNRMN